MVEQLELGTWSYGAAGAAYAVLAVLLLVSWRGKVAGALLLLAAVASAAWGAATAAVVALDLRWLGLSGLLELLRALCWFGFLISLLAAEMLVRNPDRERARGQLLRIALACVALVVLSAVLEVLDARGALGEGRLVPFLGGVVLAIGGLVLVEQVYRNSPRQHQWGLKFLALGLAAIFAFDLVLYAEGMLFGRLDLGLWIARGFANVLVVPLFAVAAARNPDWTSRCRGVWCSTPRRCSAPRSTCWSWRWPATTCACSAAAGARCCRRRSCSRPCSGWP
jgi:hypothetical protein